MNKQIVNDLLRIQLAARLPGGPILGEVESTSFVHATRLGYHDGPL